MPPLEEVVAAELVAVVAAAASLVAAVAVVVAAVRNPSAVPPSLVVVLEPSVVGWEQSLWPPRSTCSSPQKDPPSVLPWWPRVEEVLEPLVVVVVVVVAFPASFVAGPGLSCRCA